MYISQKKYYLSDRVSKMSIRYAVYNIAHVPITTKYNMTVRLLQDRILIGN